MKDQLHSAIRHRLETSIDRNRKVVWIFIALCIWVAARASFLSFRPDQPINSRGLVPLERTRLKAGDTLYFANDSKMSDPWRVLDPNHVYPNGELGILLNAPGGMALVPHSLAEELLVEP
ncbi:MAG TPA: hypothetical protein VM735_10625 [Candidatus Kapabacteria bacterium]|nr:hypothetical protein [Candidatus Kapabacteria bacterium]